jgi:hypothetical protein
VVKIFKGGQINEKDRVDDFIAGFDYGVGRVPLVASWWWSWRWPLWRPLREGKMRQLLLKKQSDRFSGGLDVKGIDKVKN